ncbi:sporulation integral membrane protein YtvI [Halanaerobacter jeridensis]|uniref:Sporulation integral membrane protein YtvI n=1 Tax=Halanaerobacter jeridensis TaxID=706427 RepID=A0A938XUA5_9FIRM|nr:sporulation integral membrane protein YtvI [Halanaerobacter jeridensis]MBM7555375.1 sporulation integral membrane protein YtvI [Halanaerobacter jeridensis]
MKDIYKIGLSVIGLIIGSIFILKYAVAYLLPFVIGILIASLIEPLVNVLQKKANFSRGVSIAVVLLIMIVIISLFLTFTVSRLFIELDKLVHEFPSYQTIGNNFSNWFHQRHREFSSLAKNWEIPQPMQETINNNFQQIYDQFRSWIQQLVTMLLKLIKRLPKLITILLISLIATFFISRDKSMILETCLAPFPEEWEKKITKLQEEIISAAVGFIRAQMILISITTLLSIVGLLILGSNYALVAGLTAGILDLIPVIGPGMVFMPWIIYNFIAGNSSFALSLLLLYIIITTVRQLSEAKIVGESIGVHPLATLVAMYLGIQLFGISGVFIGPAVVVVLRAVFKADIVSFVTS